MALLKEIIIKKNKSTNIKSIYIDINSNTATIDYNKSSFEINLSIDIDRQLIGYGLELDSIKAINRAINRVLSDK